VEDLVMSAIECTWH